jgi:glycosyltransferase involved in cell wall biosynthesis
MRILQVVHGFPPNEWAGTELVTCYLSQALQARGHQVTVFTRTGASTAAEGTLLEEEFAGLSVLRVVNTYKWYSRFSFRYDNPFFHKTFLSVLQRVQPDIVHIQHVAHLSVSLIRLAVALEYPTVLSLHDFYFPCQLIHLIDAQERFCPGPERGESCVPCLQDMATAEEVRRRFVQMEQVLQRPQVVITPSHFLAEKMQSYFPTLGDRIRTIPLGVKRLPGVVRGRAPRPADAPLRVLYVGVFLPHKGAHVLLEALKSLPKDALTVSFYGTDVVGWEAYSARLRTAAEGLPVQFRGAYAHDQFGDILVQHDVLVMPMIWEETFSLLTREAFLAGLPVIAARRGALIEAVQDGVNGLLFEPENAGDLRRCLLRLIAEPQLCEQLRSAIPHVKTMEEYVGEIEVLYQEVQSQQREEKRQSVERVAELGAPVTSPPLADTSASAALTPKGGGKDERAVVQERLPQVSVCIPTYNGAAFLAEAIESILSQSFKDFELLIVDDGSTDTTLDIARSFTDPRIVIHENETRLGIPGNWNRCLSLARGEYICIFHQDDVMMPKNLVKKVKILDASPEISFVHSAVELLVDNDAPQLLENWVESAVDDFLLEGQRYFRKLLLQGNLICAPTVVARRQDLLEVGKFDNDLGYAPDYEMWLKLCVKGRVAFVSQPLLQYRWHGGNASHQYRFARGVEELQLAAHRALQYYKQMTGLSEERELLTEIVDALSILRHWAATLEQGKEWLERQAHGWQQTAQQREQIIQDQQAWITELEKGKSWLDEQRVNWQHTAEKYERVVQEQQAWIAELEKGKQWLEEQRQRWQEEAEHWQNQVQRKIWYRLGRWLGVVKPFAATTDTDQEVPR